MLQILIESCCWYLIGCFLPIIFISIGISTIFCSKKKAVAEHKPTHKGTSSSVKKNNNDSQKPNQSSQAEPPKSKSKSKHLDSKERKSAKKDPDPVKVHAEGKTDPFDLADGDDEDGGNGKTETSTRNQSKSKKRGGGGGGGGKLPNKDGYDDLNPNKKEDEEAKSKMKTEETKSKLQQKDDGYEAIDPTKAVINIENVNESNGKTPSPANKQPNKPRQIPRDAKQQKIAKGAKKGKGDYPTFDDVISDWDSKKEEPGAGGAGGGGAGAGGAVGDKSKGQSKSKLQGTGPAKSQQ